MTDNNPNIYPLSESFSFENRAAHIEEMARQEFDLLLIGGGINGAWMALDASLRGLRVALIEAEDFGHGPSRNNSELLHGGFRYLKEWYQEPKNWFKIRSVLKLVREALREREVLMRVAPHLARPLGFCMPLYAPKGLGWAKKAFYAMGFWMYDLLSAAQIIKPFQMFSKKQTIATLNGIIEKNLIGSGLYFDCKMEPGRLLIEIIKAAASNGALLVNYVRAEKPLWDKETITGFTCRDTLKDQTFDIRAKKIIDVTGPWGDVFRHQVWPEKENQLRLTKGVHIMVKQLFQEPIACAFFTDDGRIIFVIPWGEQYQYSLVGTTDTDYSEHPDEVAPDSISMKYLEDKVRTLFPQADLTYYGNYAGIRPLIRQTGGSASSVSREHSIIHYGKTNVTSVFGGKWTTARKVAIEALDEVFPEEKGKAKTHLLRFGGENTASLLKDDKPKPDESFQSWLLKNGLNHFDEKVLNHLIFNYGRNALKVLALIKADPNLNQRILPNFPFLHAEIVYAVRFEMAMRVSDFLIRRSIFGRLRQRGLEAAPIVAEIMAKELNWSEERKQKETEIYDHSTQIIP